MTTLTATPETVAIAKRVDTHIWIWSLSRPDKPKPNAAAALVDPANERGLSSISARELLVLARKNCL